METKSRSPKAEHITPKQPDSVTTYKGFNSALQCRDFQYDIGRTYTHSGAVVPCESGFHACEHPLDVFTYYPPATSRYAEVLQSGSIQKHSSDSKIASATITITAELHLSEIIQRAIKYVFDRSKPEKGASATGEKGAASATGRSGAASATGRSGAASATGWSGAASATGRSGAASATGENGAASATGENGAASATGRSGAASATGRSGAASATGWSGKVMGAKGCALFTLYRDSSGAITHTWSGIVGQEGILPEVWYTLDSSGKIQKV